MRRAANCLTAAMLVAAAPSLAQEAPASDGQKMLRSAADDAQRKLHQTFTNLQFEDFGPAPVKGPIYQATAGGRIIYYAPETEQILFAAIYDRNGVNLTALAQDASARRRLKDVDPRQALLVGPAGAPQVIEFTDPDCPYCQALERFWATKAIEGKPVQRLVYFVSGIHPQAAAKAEHILCSPDNEAEFKAVYAGKVPAVLHKCLSGRTKVEADAQTVAKMGVSGTPTLIIDGRIISGFQQGELEAFLDARKGDSHAPR